MTEWRWALPLSHLRLGRLVLVLFCVTAGLGLSGCGKKGEVNPPAGYEQRSATLMDG